MKARSFLVAEVGSGALYQARTYTVTTKIDIRYMGFSLMVSLNCERTINTLTVYCTFAVHLAQCITP